MDFKPTHEIQYYGLVQLVNEGTEDGSSFGGSATPEYRHDRAVAAGYRAIERGRMPGSESRALPGTYLDDMEAAAKACRQVAPTATCSCHRGGPDPHDGGAGAMWHELRARIEHYKRASYEASRRS